MKLTDDWTLAGVPIKRCNMQMALYAAHIATGSSLLCKSVMAATVEKYLLNVARFLANFSSRDVRKEGPTSQGLSEPVKAVLVEMERWEKVALRREPFTVEMQEYLNEQTANLPSSNKRVIFSKWSTCGLYGAFRLNEYAQPAGHSWNNPLLDPEFNPKAFCLGDLEFTTKDKKYLSLSEVLQALAKEDHEFVYRITLTFRFQKNGENGQVKSFIRNDKKPHLCFVRAMLAILLNFIELAGHHYTKPLAIYKDENGVVRALDSSIIEENMRDAAANVYNINPLTITGRKKLQRWSSHSIRVGACVILYAVGLTPTHIQFMLRWKSMAFMVYLRNLTFLCEQQNTSINKVADMPNFV
jgi:hypothetical protein